MSLDLPVNEIKLDRGETGLGFNIRGGIDIPHLKNDSGIFVTKLKENGAANRDGRIKEGDKLLEINGHDLRNVTHSEAVQAFLSAGNTIVLKVQHGAEKHILELLKDSKKPVLPVEPVKKSSGFSYLMILFGLLSAGGVAFFAYKKYKQGNL